MVVLARPRDPNSASVTLEEGDVTEDFLEKPYVELLGDTADSSSLQRSLSARVRRRERVGGEVEERYQHVIHETLFLMQRLCCRTAELKCIFKGSQE